MTAPKTKFDWKIERQRQDKADALAQEVLEYTGYNTPVEPLELVRAEGRRLKAVGGDLGNAFDGQLEYHRAERKFVLIYNTRYDGDGGRFHPRTRFSIAHELGHYHLPAHHGHLLRGGRPHKSRAEFAVDEIAEREADAFAAGILLPRREVSARINGGGELTLDAVTQVAASFDVSLVSAAIRCVKLTHFPAAVAGLRPGKPPWFFWSKALEEAGCFRRKGAELPSATAREQLDLFQCGRAQSAQRECRLEEWFTMRDGLEDVLATEEYVPIAVMGTLLVLLSADEGDLFEE